MYDVQTCISFNRRPGYFLIWKRLSMSRNCPHFNQRVLVHCEGQMIFIQVRLVDFDDVFTFSYDTYQTMIIPQETT